MKSIFGLFFLFSLFMFTLIGGLPSRDKMKCKYILLNVKNNISRWYSNIKKEFNVFVVYIFFVVIGLFITEQKGVGLFINPFSINNCNVIKDALNFFTVSYGAIIAIITSLMFFYYSYVQQKFSRYTKIYIRENSFVVPYIIVVLNLVIGLFYLSRIDNLNLNLIRSYYLNLILFVVTVVYLLFIIKRSAQIVYAKDIYIRKIKNIDQFDVEYFKRGWHSNYSDEIERLESNNIYVISELLLNYIDLKDNISSRLIITFVTQRMELIIKNDIGKQGIEVRDIINSLGYLFNKSIIYAFEKKNISVIYYVIEMYIQIHLFCSENNVQWSEYFEFDEYINKMISIVLGTSDEEVKRRLFYRLMYLQISHICNNCPKKEEIMLFYWSNKMDIPKHDELKDNQWDYVERKLTWTILSIGDEIIKINDDELYTSFIYACSHHISEIALLNIDDFLKKAFLNSWLSSFANQIKKSIQCKIYKTNTSFYPLESFFNDEIFKRKDNTSINLVNYTLQINDALLDNKYYTLEVIESIFRGLRIITENILKEEFYLKALKYIFEYLKIFTKKYINIENKTFYVHYYELIEQNKKFLEKQIGETCNHYFDSILTELSEYPQIRKEFEEKTIKWPDEIKKT